MSLHVRVQGGTNAGRKKPLRERAGEWYCRCTKRPGYLVRCNDCGTDRPK